ncbi:MAG: dihydrodipicolinate synthase family protein [Roseibacillus sp.]|jgi:N-acetylneuraminate lyase|nr:dihydrodipicolinate synthase family protein [Roseibacillus sp.]
MEALGIKGLVAAVVTPMDLDGELNLGLVPRIAAHLEGIGISGVYIAGSTGEGMSLTDDERRAVAEAYVESCRGKMHTVVQVGHNSMKAAAALAAHAEAIGVDAISATPTGYFQADGERGLVGAMAAIVEAAPKTPFYYYHIPKLSGTNMNPMRFTELAMNELPTFCGIKYSDGGTVHNLPLLQKIAPELEFLSGSDEGYLQSLAIGYQGAVGSTYNYAAPLYHKVREAFEGGDMPEARLWQGRAMEMIEAMLASCGRASLKAMMAMVGIDCGPSRRPVEPATPEQFANLRTSLEQMGWFAWMNMDGAGA